MKLYDYQQHGVVWLQSKNLALLADEMGVGKTPQAIVAAAPFWRVLVVCPSTAKVNWQREFIKFDGRLSQVITAKDYKPRENTVITNFEQVANRLSTYTSQRWDAVIVDESHFVKAYDAKRTNAIYGKKGLVHFTGRLWCLTGTPAPNHVGELWPMLFTFGMTPLRYQAFITRYCTLSHIKNKYNAWKVSGTKMTYIHEIQHMLQRCALRRLKREVLSDMPMLSVNPYIIEEPEGNPYEGNEVLMAKLRAELELVKAHVDLLDIDTDDEYVLQQLSFLSQSISSLRRYHGLKKATVIASMVADELDSFAYGKIILFCHHRDVVKVIFEALKQFNPVVLVGGMNEAQKQYAVDTFQTDDRCRVFIGNSQSAGVAITLTAASEVGLVEPDWVPAVNQQAIMRAHRIGQRNPVNVRIFQMAGFDERLTRVVARKTREISAFITH